MLRQANMPSRHPAYTISALAKEFALTTRAIRFYEDEGLIAPQRVGRVRVYGERERVRLKLILRGKRLGLALSEIGELLDMYEVSRNERGQLAKFVELLADRRARLLQQKDDIDATLAEIDGIERECRRQLKDAAQARSAAPAHRAGGRAGSESQG
jgi:DNA-binding transcriptional MerR regulator